MRDALAVVFLATLRVTQHVVRENELLEAARRLLVLGEIRVQFLRARPERERDLGSGRVRRNAEHRVIVGRTVHGWSPHASCQVAPC